MISHTAATFGIAFSRPPYSPIFVASSVSPARPDVPIAEPPTDARLAAALDHKACKQEERGDREAVVDLMDGAAGQPVRSEREGAERHQTEVTKTRVGEDAIPVGLRECRKGAQQDTDRGQSNDGWRQGSRRIGQERQGQFEKREGAHLQKERRQQERYGKRPGVGRHRQPPAEYAEQPAATSYEEGDKHPPLHMRWQRKLPEYAHVECSRAGYRLALDVHQEKPEQHDDARNERDDANAGRDAGPSASRADEDAHRRGSDHPGQPEQKQIERHVDAEQAAFEEQRRDVELAPARRFRQHRDQAHERRQQDEQSAQAVDAKRVTRADRRQDVEALGKLPLRATNLEREPEGQGCGEADGRRAARERAKQAVAAVEDAADPPSDEDHQSGGSGHEHDDRQEVTFHVLSTLF